MARAPPQLPAHMPGLPQGVPRLQRGRHGAGARAHGGRCAPAALDIHQRRPRDVLVAASSCGGSRSDTVNDMWCLCAGHAGAGLCWNVAPKQPAHFEVVDVQWGFMKVDANATHIAMDVRRHNSACKLPQRTSSL